MSTQRPSSSRGPPAPCLVAGAESQFWPAAHATAMAALNEDVEAVVLEGCGHPVNIDDPEAFNATLLRFLAG